MKELPSREDFLQWKSNEVTQVVYSGIKERIEGIKELLVSSAGNDPNEDRMLVGMIKAYRTILDTDYSEVSGE
jgi:hypothetical protein